VGRHHQENRTEQNKKEASPKLLGPWHNLYIRPEHTK
jgi:hypothetical protein